MSSLEPIEALNLDSIQQEEFLKYLNSLPEKPPTTVRIFDRNDYYSVHGADATTAAQEVFSSTSKIKKMGLEPNKLEYVVLSKGNFEILIKKLLLVRRYRVEIYVSDGPVTSNNWELKYKGSPGYMTQLEEVLCEMLGSTEEQTPCLMAVNMKTDPISKCRLIGVGSITAGEYQMSVAEFTDDDLLTQLETITVQMAPSECLVPQSEGEDYKVLMKVMERANVTVTKLKKSEFSTEGLIQDLNRLLKFEDSQQQDANTLPETKKTVAMGSIAAALKYIELMSDSTNFCRFRLSTFQADCFLHLDAAALTALNVIPDINDTSHSPSRSLLGLLDRCRTQHGKRLLPQWLRQPLRDINLINERLDVVELLVNKSQLRLQLHDDYLRRIPDLQALARRLTRQKANLNDCYKIYQVVTRLPSLFKCLAEADNVTVYSTLAEPICELNEELSKYKDMIEATVDMDAIDRGDFLVKPSFDEMLQSLYRQLDDLQRSAEVELNKAAEDLGFESGKTIKLEVNPQTGFTFRVTLKEEQTLRDNEDYIIIDAVKNGVRFTTTTLENVSEEYMQTKELYKKEQDKVVVELVAIAAGYSECLFALSHVAACLDVLVAFAVAASTAPYPYCRPVVTESLQEFILKDVRHPCLELLEGVSYIPNDVQFKRDTCLMHIVTGANMGGKSTWMRSCGVTALLAHAGCMVPARIAIVPRLRALCTRVGASDSEDKGQSTFMMEMIESAALLRTASKDSLVLVDELGRGTSTYDGCGMAWAIAEELAMKSKCFCLFATHYHELTRLASLYPNVIVNSHAEASLVDGELLLLHRIVPGPATQSLGLHVARLADLPDSIIEYAEAKQAQLDINLFEVNNPLKTQDSSEGQALIMDFLRKCKEIHESTPDDKEMRKKIDQLKMNLLNKNNKYVLSLL